MARPRKSKSDSGSAPVATRRSARIGKPSKEKAVTAKQAAAAPKAASQATEVAPSAAAKKKAAPLEDVRVRVEHCKS